MSESFVGEIRMFAGNFAPRGWAFCDGQLLQVSQNDALFSLLGTIYGGDGRTTFGLPDLRGRTPLHLGSGPGLTPRQIGQKSGVENVTLTSSQLASHTHSYQASSDGGNEANPSGNVASNSPSIKMYIEDPPSVAMATTAIANTGGSQRHNNMMPFLCVHFIISLFGVYPSR
jgi:microcystin-dependent protein